MLSIAERSDSTAPAKSTVRGGQPTQLSRMARVAASPPALVSAGPVPSACSAVEGSTGVAAGLATTALDSAMSPGWSSGASTGAAGAGGLATCWTFPVMSMGVSEVMALAILPTAGRHLTSPPQRNAVAQEDGRKE